ACTEACRLWPSREAYKADPEGNKTNIFTIGRDGTLRVWGLDPAKTYYIKEVGPPTPKGWENLPESLQYALTNGIIRLTLDKNGLNSYSATILEEPGADPPVSHGFTVHGFRIDEGSQTAYVNITNARNWVEHTTSVYVQKIWNDREDHTYDGVTVYLNVTDPDGTVRRLREITLSRENDWEYTWTNLPLYVLGEDGLTESEETVKYSVSEAYISGYTASVIKLKNGEYTETTWGDSDKLTHGQSYLLRNGSQYLSAVSADKQTLCWVDEAAAKTSPLALWTATVSDSNVKLTNGAGQSLTYYSSGSTRYYYLTTGSSTNQNLKQTTSDGRFRLGYTVSSGWGGSTTYYLSELNSSSYASASSNSNHIYFVAEQKKETTTSVALSGYGYQITNTPLSSETALKVVKYWDDPSGKVSRYEQAQVTFRLLANNKDTGRTETVSLKTNWTATFRGLPYYDENGKPIIYTVEESWDNDDWIPIYGSISTVNGTIPTYETTVTNQYRWTNATELPATGGLGILPYILCGVPLVAAPLVYGLSLRRKYERGVKE
ncbi:MAG: Cna B-type domain-containing protein, partial [Clostridia bacterium]|nr:Cna B-type domain-containing protein [Clostridia bacterium]